MQSRERQRKESIGGKDETEDRNSRHERLQSPNPGKVTQPSTNLKTGQSVFIIDVTMDTYFRFRNMMLA